MNKHERAITFILADTMQSAIFAKHFGLEDVATRHLEAAKLFGELLEHLPPTLVRSEVIIAECAKMERSLLHAGEIQ